MVVDAFISHIAADRSVAIRLHAALSEAGVVPWCAACDLTPGERWDRAIPAALQMARVVLVLVSPAWPVHGAALDGWYGPEEVALAIDCARERGPRTLVVPVRLDGAGVERLPYGLRRLVEIEAGRHALAPIVRGAQRALATIRERERPLPRPTLDATLTDPTQRPEDIDDGDTIPHERSTARGDVIAGEGVGRYVLEARLGQGRFVSVWRAYDPALDERVAVKILRDRWRRDRATVARFRRSAEQMSQMHHPGIVSLLTGPLRDRGRHYYAMPFFPNGDLQRAILRESWPMSADEGLRAVLAVGEALAYAHARGIVHRAVGPSDILLDVDGRARLSDFDLGRAGERGGGGRFRSPYAAPELYDDPRAVGPAADVYGLGMTAAFVLRGEPLPHRAKLHAEALIVGLPATAAVKSVLARATAAAPDARTRDAAAFVDDLRRALALARHDSLELLLPATLVVTGDTTTLDRTAPPGLAGAEATTLDRTGPPELDETDPAALDPTAPFGPPPWHEMPPGEETLATDLQPAGSARPRPLAPPAAAGSAGGPRRLAAALDRAFAVNSGVAALARLESPRRGLRAVPTPLWFVAALLVLGSLKLGPLVLADPAPQATMCARVSSDPPGATVWLPDRRAPSTTPADLTGLVVGEPYAIALERAGHHSERRVIRPLPIDGLSTRRRSPPRQPCLDVRVRLCPVGGDCAR